MKKKILMLIIALSILLPLMLVYSYAETNAECVTTEQDDTSAADSEASETEGRPTLKEIASDILDGELVEDEVEIKILKTILAVIIIVLVVRFLLLLAGI